MQYKIIETTYNGETTYQVFYKKNKWWWFGWRTCYYDIEYLPKTYYSLQQCKDAISNFKKDKVITYVFNE